MIKPADIKDQGFRKGLFGYKTDEVNNFVNVVYRAYDELYKKHEQMTKDFENLDASLKESRVKIFELESKVQDSAGSSSDNGELASAKQKADEIIRNAEASAADIIARAKAQSEKFEKTATKAAEPKLKMASKPEVKAEPKQTTSSSKFFKKAEEQPQASGDDNEIFVGEIEDARKPDRMMIGDGEEEEDLDFEFL